MPQTTIYIAYHIAGSSLQRCVPCANMAIARDELGKMMDVDPTDEETFQTAIEEADERDEEYGIRELDLAGLI